MIPKTATAYCREDISLIENYEQALNDKTQTWDCHHKLEIELGVSQYELKKRKLFWKRPASELIFLTHGEHIRLHKIGNQNTKGKHWKISNPRKDEDHHMYGKHLTEEHKNKLRGKTPWNKGKSTPEETRAKIGATMKGKNAKAVHQIHKATGIIIREWKCIREAARVLGIHSNHISYCCKGKLKSAGGFIWRYVN